MADNVYTNVLRHDDEYYIAHFTNFCDGTGESAVSKIDVSTVAPHGLIIEEIWYSTHEMGVHLYWDATADELILSCPKDESGHLDFSSIGGLKYPDAIAGITGDILFSTTDATGNDTYAIVLKCRKF